MRLHSIVALTIKIFPFCIGILLLIQIVISNDLAAKSQDVYRYDKEIRILQEENLLLSQKVASASSLTTISSKAKNMGFVPFTRSISIGQDRFSVALR